MTAQDPFSVYACAQEADEDIGIGVSDSDFDILTILRRSGEVGHDSGRFVLGLHCGRDAHVLTCRQEAERAACR